MYSMRQVMLEVMLSQRRVAAREKPATSIILIYAHNLFIVLGKSGIPSQLRCISPKFCAHTLEKQYEIGLDPCFTPFDVEALLNSPHESSHEFIILGNETRMLPRRNKDF